MKQSELGLPPEYQQMPEYFDAHNTSEDTREKNAVIESLLRKHRVKSVLDMTCGTGSQVFYLSDLGYEVMGSDFSPALLKIARTKAMHKNIDVNFTDGDMRDVHLGQFDAVITIFNAVGHLTKTNFEKAMRNIHRNLKPGGIYVFDIFNLEAMTDATVSNFSMLLEKQVNNDTIHLSQFSTLDRENGLLTSYNNYSIQTEINKPKHFQSQFTLQIYEARELQTILSQSGFETIFQYDMMGESIINSESINILTVARKK